MVERDRLRDRLLGRVGAAHSRGCAEQREGVATRDQILACSLCEIHRHFLPGRPRMACRAFAPTLYSVNFATLPFVETCRYLGRATELPSTAIENTVESTHALPASYLLDGPDDGMSRAHRRSSVDEAKYPDLKGEWRRVAVPS